MDSANYAECIAESDASRCRHIRFLIRSRSPRSSSSDESFTQIPKVVVQYWHNSDSIPSDVQECIDSWAPFERLGYRRILFNDDLARTFISKQLGERYIAAFDRCHHPAMRSDYLRLCFILLQGGFYVDADEVYSGKNCDHLFADNRLKLQPLCYDSVRDKMVPPECFTQSDKTYPEWIFYVNNNPIVSPPNHPVIRLALNRATDVLLAGNRTPTDIQSTTGPGNLTASLVKHSILSIQAGDDRDFVFLDDWQSISFSPWDLSYRNDARNWRLWDLS